jgi:uncharacterized protein (TIGR00304 family)
MKKMLDTNFLFSAGLFLIVIGVFIVAVAVILSSCKGGKSEVKGAGVIMIGPIPIIFGSDKKSVMIAIVLAIVLMVLLIFLYYYLLR